jgi:hypothetical protein
MNYFSLFDFRRRLNAARELIIFDSISKEIFGEKDDFIVLFDAKIGIERFIIKFIVQNIEDLIRKSIASIKPNKIAFYIVILSLILQIVYRILSIRIVNPF